MQRGEHGRGMGCSTRRMKGMWIDQSVYRIDQGFYRIDQGVHRIDQGIYRIDQGVYRIQCRSRCLQNRSKNTLMVSMHVNLFQCTVNNLVMVQVCKARE